MLAADRNILASERTYAAWVRTGLLALAGGIGARALKDVPNWLALANGTLLIGFSLFCFGAAVWRQREKATECEPRAGGESRSGKTPNAATSRDVMSDQQSRQRGC